MHPGPVNRGVEIAIDLGELPGSVVKQQVTNGISVRMAVLYDLLSANPNSTSDIEINDDVAAAPKEHP